MEEVKNEMELLSRSKGLVCTDLKLLVDRIKNTPMKEWDESKKGLVAELNFLRLLLETIEYYP